MAQEPAIDPRYDPAFQRGFNGTVPPRGEGSPARAAAPHVTSALQRPVAAPRPQPVETVPSGGSPVTATEPEPAVEAPAASVAPLPVGVVRPPWTNPFAIAVAVIGVAVLAAGIWLLQETFQLTQSEGGFSTQADYWFLQWGMIGGPIFLGLGIAILVAVLVFCAAYWAHRPVGDDVE